MASGDNRAGIVSRAVVQILCERGPSAPGLRALDLTPLVNARLGDDAFPANQVRTLTHLIEDLSVESTSDFELLSNTFMIALKPGVVCNQAQGLVTGSEASPGPVLLAAALPTPAATDHAIIAVMVRVLTDLGPLKFTALAAEIQKTADFTNLDASAILDLMITEMSSKRFRIFATGPNKDKLGLATVTV